MQYDVRTFPIVVTKMIQSTNIVRYSKVRCIVSTIIKVRSTIFVLKVRSTRMLAASTRIVGWEYENCLKYDVIFLAVRYDLLEVRERKKLNLNSSKSQKKRFDVVFLYIYLFYSSLYFSTYLNT